MSPDQVRLAAIRARINGVWDHPALQLFGPQQSCDLLAILDILNDEVTPSEAQEVNLGVFQP